MSPARRAAVASVGLCLLVAATAAELFPLRAESAERSPANEIRSLVFSPDGDRVAVVIAGTGEQPAPRATLYTLSAGEPGESPEFVADHVSQAAAWLTSPTRLVFGTVEGGQGRLVAKGPAEQETATPSAPAVSIGAVGARGTTVAAVAALSDGTSELWIWQVGGDRVSRWRVPASFAPSLRCPPVISASRQLVAIVDRDGDYFISVRTTSGSWLKPAKQSMWDKTWEWRPVGSTDLGRGSWLTAGGPKHDRFVVDEKSLALWDFATPMASGPHVRMQGALVRLQAGDLVPLDPDAHRSGSADVTHHITAPNTDDLGPFSVTDDLKRVALFWQGGYLARHDAGGRQEGLVTDGSAGPAVLSISPDGKLLASGKHGEQVILVDTATRKEKAAWPLSQFADRNR